MADIPIPEPLETPPRTTGNTNQDFTLIVDWMWKVYQKMQEAVLYINNQVSNNPDLNIERLPDPATATVASAQETANQAYVLANDQRSRINGFYSGEVLIDEANTSESVTFSDDQVQPDADYRIWVQAKAISGSPDPDAFTVRTKTYTETGFTITIIAAPGVGASVTFEWQLIRNT